MSSGGSNLSGRTLGQFEIMDEIGRGGMATVYRARQRSINRIVAIKVLPPALMHDPTFYERFTREVDVISHLEHPHILPIYDYGEAEGIPFIAMRYLAGGSMAQVMRRGLPPFDWLVKPLDQIGQALDYAHQQGVVHRDLKPGNILLDERDNAYLTDFGIARVLNSSLTGSAIIGTPAYMSPEQANALPLDARSDIYSFGIVLYELLTGREPYEAETPVALLLKHLNEPIPLLRERRPETPEAIEWVVQRATAKNPADRYASAGEMAAAYAAAVRGDSWNTPSAATPVAGARPRIESSSVLDEDSATITPPAVKTRRAPAPEAPEMMPVSGRRSRVPLILAAIALILAAVVVAGLLVSTSGPLEPVYVTPTPQIAAAPAAFPGGTAITGSGYSLTVPEGWVFADLSSPDQVVHRWQNGQDATVRLVRATGAETDGDFRALIDRYEAEHFPPGAFSRIDEATAPDGTVRRSYRLTGETAQGLEAGQTDVFFREAAPGLIALELYAADRWGNTLTPIYQQVLDSLRVTS
ncbi:MAG: serine/threonine protein kinase [Anaerolineae bacterium]|nr:serine/threonine protein kinase [Anaerolineae bacterium]